MSRITEIRKSVTDSTPVLAVVGATDVVVERVRHTTTTVAHRAEQVQAELEDALTTYRVELRKGLEAAQAEVGKTIAAYQASFEPAALQENLQKALEPKRVQAAVQQVPALAVSRALEVAGEVETRYTGLAERGKQLVERVRQQQATQELIAQGRTTLSRTRAAVTTARKAVDDTTTAARGAVTIGRREAGETVDAAAAEVEQSVAKTEKVVSQRTSGTRTAVKRTTATARTRAAQTRTAAKRAATSARSTVEKAGKAAEDAAEKVGD